MNSFEKQFINLYQESTLIRMTTKIVTVVVAAYTLAYVLKAITLVSTSLRGLVNAWS